VQIRLRALLNCNHRFCEVTAPAAPRMWRAPNNFGGTSGTRRQRSGNPRAAVCFVVPAMVGGTDVPPEPDNNLKVIHLPRRRHLRPRSSWRQPASSGQDATAAGEEQMLDACTRIFSLLLAVALLILAEFSGPILRQQAIPHVAVKRRQRPIARSRDKAMLGPCREQIPDFASLNPGYLLLAGFLVPQNRQQP
jgi:hypothetical protein